MICRTLSRIDLAFAGRCATPAVPRATPEASDDAAPARCRQCLRLLTATPTRLLGWCETCRGAFLHETGQLFCRVPTHWRPMRFLRYWGEGVNGARDRWSARAFAEYAAQRINVPHPAAATILITPRPDITRIGRLAIEHGMLSRVDAAWILRFQRSTRAHRRRCFGEIAVSLGLWQPGQLARLLAAQAERRRGLAPAIMHAHGYARWELIEIESEFFGLTPGWSGDCQFELMMRR